MLIKFESSKNLIQATRSRPMAARWALPYCRLAIPSNSFFESALEAVQPFELRNRKIRRRAQGLITSLIPFQLLKLLDNTSVEDFAVGQTTQAKHNIGVCAQRKSLDRAVAKSPLI